MHQPSAQARPSIYYDYQVHRPWVPPDPRGDRKQVVVVGAGPAGVALAAPSTDVSAGIFMCAPPPGDRQRDHLSRAG